MARISSISQDAFYLKYQVQVSSFTFVTFNSLPHNPDFKQPQEKRTFENIVGKREDAGDQHFLLFLQCFLLIPKHISSFQQHLFCYLQLLSI